MVETCTVKEKQDYKKLKNLKIEINKWKEDLGEKITENTEQWEEIICWSKRWVAYMMNWFLLQREKRKDELLILQVKARTYKLRMYSLRQIYLKQ